MSPRVIQLPLSGRDRRHYVRELREAERAHAVICERLNTVIKVAEAHRIAAWGLSCEEWNLRQFIGGDAAPRRRSPTRSRPDSNCSRSSASAAGGTRSWISRW